MNHVNGTVVSVVASSVEEIELETKDYELVFAFFPLNTASRSKSKYWWTRNQDNVSEWSDMST